MPDEQVLQSLLVLSFLYLINEELGHIVSEVLPKVNIGSSPKVSKNHGSLLPEDTMLIAIHLLTQQTY